MVIQLGNPIIAEGQICSQVVFLPVEQPDCQPRSLGADTHTETDLVVARIVYALQNPGVPQGIRIARIGVVGTLLLFVKRPGFQGIGEAAMIKCMLPHLLPETMQRRRVVAPHLVGGENGGMKVRQPAPLQIRRDFELLPAIQDVIDC